jgi:hypothetical protein
MAKRGFDALMAGANMSRSAVRVGLPSTHPWV